MAALSKALCSITGTLVSIASCINVVGSICRRRQQLGLQVVCSQVVLHCILSVFEC